MINASDRGLAALVGELMSECPCERGRGRDGCSGPVDRDWIVETILDADERREWERRRAASRSSKAVAR
jgi:hypothetical protein